MSFINFENRTKFMWNVAYNYVMKIKDDYIEAFGELDTFSIKEMCERLDTPEYNNFLLCVDIPVQGSLNLLGYSLIKGGDIDINTNPNSIYREMRGIVINMETEEIVLAPFRKFFNIGQIEEFSFEVFSSQLKKAKSVEITNKLDGSMSSCRYYNGDIMVAGTGSILGGKNFRLNETYSWLVDNYKKMLQDNPNITFIFEYISLKDKHIVIYKEKEQGLYLVGARDIYTGKEWSYKEIQDIAEKYNIPMPKIEDTSFNEIENQSTQYSSSQKEGWVINIDGIKYKFKCDDYLQVHHLLEAISSKNILIKAVADGTVDDILGKLPTNYKKAVLEDIETINKYVKRRMEEIYSYYNKVKDKETEKEMAIACKELGMNSKMMGYMFSLRYGKEINILHPRPEQYLKSKDIFLNT